MNPPGQNMLLHEAVETALYLQNFAYGHNHNPNNHQYAFDALPRRTFLGTVIPIIKQMILYAIVSACILLTSIAMYGMIYWIVMPEPYAAEPIFFNYNYDCRCAHAGVHADNRDHMEYGPEYPGHLYCPPTAAVDLTAMHTQWSAHVPSVPPLDMTSLFENNHKEEVNVDIKTAAPRRILHPNKHYVIQVALTLPESPQNKDIGMFMIEIKMRDSTAKRNLLASSSRPTMLPYQSTYVSMVRKSFSMIPLVLGAFHEARTVVVECFDHFVESDEYPLGIVEIQLIIPGQLNMRPTMRHDGSMVSTSSIQNIQVVGAELRIGKELNLLQATMKNWFYTCACIIIFFLIVVQAAMYFGLQTWWRLVNNAQSGEKYSHAAAALFSVPSHVDFDQVSQSKSSQVAKDSSAFSGERRDRVDLYHEESSEMWESMSNVQEVKSQASSLKNKEGEQDEKDKKNDRNNAYIEIITAVNKNEISSDNTNKKKSAKVRKRKKKKNLSKDKSELRANLEDERILAERVMRGNISPYEVFTDLDDPDS